MLHGSNFVDGDLDISISTDHFSSACRGLFPETCNLFSSTKGSLLQVDWRRNETSVVLQLDDTLMSITEMAVCGNRLYVVVQHLDRLTDSLCECHEGQLRSAMSLSDRLQDLLNYSWSVSLESMGDQLLLQDKVNSRCWTWKPDKRPQELVNVDWNDSVVAAGSGGRIWKAPKKFPGVLRCIESSGIVKEVFVERRLIATDIVEYAQVVWGVDDDERWFKLCHNVQP